MQKLKWKDCGKIRDADLSANKAMNIPTFYTSTFGFLLNSWHYFCVRFSGVLHVLPPPKKNPVLSKHTVICKYSLVVYEYLMPGNKALHTEVLPSCTILLSCKCNQAWAFFKNFCLKCSHKTSRQCCVGVYTQ